MEMEKTMEAANEAIEKLIAKIDEATGSFKEAKEFKQETVQKALLTEEEEQNKNAYKGYSFANAKYDKTHWDTKQKKGFSDFIKMVAQNDKAAIQKAFGDNAYTATTSAGGYLVPDEFRPEIARLAYQRSLALQKATVIPMAGLKLEMPSVTTGYSASWGSINTQITDSKLTLGQVTLSAEKLTALSLVPNELLMGSGISVAELIANEMAEAFAKKLDEEVIQGDASDTTNHKFDGICYDSGVNSVTGSVDADPTLAKLVTEDNLLAVVGELAGSTALDGAEWFIHPTVWNVIRGLEDGASSKIVRLNERYQYDLLGFPVNLTNQAPYAETAELPVLAFGNMRYAYIGDAMDFRVETSRDERFSYDQTVFKGIQNVAVDIAIPSAFAILQFGAAS